MFHRTDDAIVVELTEREAVFIGQIPVLLDSIGTPGADPGYSVLHRPLYLDDASVDDDLRELLAQELEAQRTSDRLMLGSWSRGRSVMTIDEAHGFLRTINEARLVLAARAGAFDQGPAWEERIDQDPALAAVAWLGYVQSELVRALSTA